HFGPSNKKWTPWGKKNVLSLICPRSDLAATDMALLPRRCAAATGLNLLWFARLSFMNGPKMGNCANRRSLACVKTSQLTKWFGRTYETENEVKGWRKGSGSLQS